jgi:hypothetical protein
MACEMASKNDFGCEQCWPSSAAVAWTATRSLTLQAVLIDESHYRVSIRGCHVCPQRFLLVFTEMIDWVDGEDPQDWTRLPISHSEAATLSKSGDSLTESEIETVGSIRKSLKFTHPKGTGPECYWGIGISVGPHD